MLAERAPAVALVVLLLFEQRMRREGPAPDSVDLSQRPVERAVRPRPVLEPASDERAGLGEFDEEDLDRLAVLLEVDRSVGELSDEREPSGGERP